MLTGTIPKTNHFLNRKSSRNVYGTTNATPTNGPMFQMHQTLAEAQMTMMTQLAQNNNQQNRALLQRMMEMMLRINNA